MYKKLSLVIRKFHIDPDITKAETLPASFYRDREVFEAIKNRIFYRTWQWVGDENLVNAKRKVYPFTLLDNYLTEPMVLTRDDEGIINCLSNVCTHRGNLVVKESTQSKKLICGYHGRRFQLDGAFEHMPEFKETKDFPKPCDDLHQFPLRQWGPFLFAGLNPYFDFQQVLDVMNERV
ncbi:MAG: Rieske (2Fe-2S) protein, partial [Flavobacteriaceae bacterium]